MTPKQIRDAKTSDLVKFYNENNDGKDIKKFVNRKTAEERVTALIKSMRAKPVLSPEEIKANRAAGIAKSWTKSDIHVKRSQRSAVEVDGVRYRSVKQAFDKLGLPLNEHINFRMTLKAEGSQRCYDREWKIIPLNY